MKKKLAYLVLALFCCLVWGNRAEAVVYKQNGCSVRFPDKCDTLWNFTNGVEATESSKMENEYRMAFFLPVPLSEEESKICNGKKELSKMNEDELRNLARHLFDKYNRAGTILLKSEVAVINGRKVPIIYFSDNNGQRSIEVQVIAKGYSCILVCHTHEKYAKEAEVEFMKMVDSFKIE